MRRFSLVTLAAAIAVAAFIAPPAFAQQEVSEIPYVSVPDFLKSPPIFFYSILQTLP